MPRRGRRSPGRNASGDRTDRLDELEELVELAAGSDVQVRRVQPAQAAKSYICPGCQQEITQGTGHLVVVPTGAPAARRHWHTPCWVMRERRRPGR
ncbi:MAG TPA: hypothetical protein VME46_20640 [Acidimicrobiales bacterium]|nr:hypothetical protein [Acidimicrobiales bacterium]